ncbi:hypothetical protein L1887_14808 [Cichorium endivia]|nr:hypothetical protein L1887_14808 [Cichorium endivia]
MERRPPEHPLEATPPPVDVFVPLLLSRAKLQFSDATESSDEDMLIADANTLMGSPTPLAIFHPPNALMQIVETKVALPSLLGSPPTSTPHITVSSSDLAISIAESSPQAQLSSNSLNVCSDPPVNPVNIDSSIMPPSPKRPLSSDSQSAQNIAPPLRIAAAQHQILSPVDAISSPISKPSDSLALNLIYDLNPDDFSGKNQFDILNAIDDSFSAFCEPNGLASSIMDCENNSSSGLKLAGDNLRAPPQNSSLNLCNSSNSGSSNCSRMDIEGKKTQVQESPSTTSPVLYP